MSKERDLGHLDLAALELDRNAWAEEHFISFGVTLGIRANRPGLLALARERLPPGAQEMPSGGERVYSLCELPGSTQVAVFRGSEPLGQFERDAALDRLEGDAKLFVAEMAPEHTFVHAGVVEWRQRAILVPGRTHAGKSTLVDALVRAGATYYSDEYAVLDRGGHVGPYPAPASMRQADGTCRRVRFDRVGQTPLTLGTLVVTQFESSQTTFAPRELSMGEAMIALIQNTVSVRREPARAMRAFAVLLAGAPVLLAGKRGDAEPTVRRLLSTPR